MSEIIYAEVPYKEILLLILGTVSTFLVWKIQYQKEKIKTIENLVSDKKYKLYSELIYIFLILRKAKRLEKH